MSYSHASTTPARGGTPDTSSRSPGSSIVPAGGTASHISHPGGDIGSRRSSHHTDAPDARCSHASMHSGYASLMAIAHYYHVWAGGAWAPPCNEHDRALSETGFPVKPLCGVTGPPQDRAVFAQWAHEHGWEIVIEADEGWEQLTLCELRRWARLDPVASTVLYMHAKGSRHDLHGTNTAWRREMTKRLIGEWGLIQMLLLNHDAVGCCWRNAAEFYPHMKHGNGMFAGNFWWSTRYFLATLPPLEHRTAGDAECWIGQGSPDVIDMLPSWPLHTLVDGQVLAAHPQHADTSGRAPVQPGPAHKR